MIRLALSLLASATLLAGCSAGRLPRVSPEPLPTRAERSGYTETSTHADVLAFLRAARERSRATVEAGHATDSLRTVTFGVTGEGRALPLVVWGAPSATAASARATGKTRVLVFANIHAGEVDGKEAMLELVRALADGEHAEWADSLVLMIAPIYNADGNERIDVGNRPGQLGPDAGMGQRPNAAGYDLNRDFMRLAAPESRALVALLRDWDPHVVVDLHTTNGSVVGYQLTYAPPLSPDTPPAIVRLLRDEWLPAITDTLLATDDLATWHYGNVPGSFGEPVTVPRGWYSFSGQPRYSNNYVGMRGRLGMLSESYSYAPYRERILASRRFVEEVIAQTYRHATRVRRVAEAADAMPVAGQSFALRSTFAALDQPHAVLLGAVDTVAHPATGEPRLMQRRDVRTPETMPAFLRFEATETTVAPAAYAVLFGPHQQAVRDLLDAHGIRYDLGTTWGQRRERFVVDSVRVATEPRLNVSSQEVWGRWRPIAAEPGGPPRLAASLIVPTDQPLGRLVVALLEPRADDGVVAWGLVSVGELAPGDELPIERLP